ncbi:hypothetical protein [Erythrobacter sp. SD-21]|uniref:hypothetical protein n=1 Tax=Erythrobacter sp. SD-21 TaxID=161528 RepID=UPI000153F0D8|nr:hypothetical protein [Erythrobacter sp. SD-21]EDL47798.1 hypothetical protein ED21_24991 [Erythrobacter sp. SD-21]
MRDYELRYAEPADHNSAPVHFQAVGFADALDYARRIARGAQADLYQDGHPICSMELVNDVGVWLVGRPRSLVAETPLIASQPQPLD